MISRLFWAHTEIRGSYNLSGVVIKVIFIDSARDSKPLVWKILQYIVAEYIIFREFQQQF